MYNYSKSIIKENSIKKIWLGAISTKYVVNIKLKKNHHDFVPIELWFLYKMQAKIFQFCRMVSVDCTTSVKKNLYRSVDCTTSVKKTYIGIVSFSQQTKLILCKSKKWGGFMTKRTSRFCFKLSNYTILVNFNLS